MVDAWASFRGKVLAHFKGIVDEEWKAMVGHPLFPALLTLALLFENVSLEGLDALQRAEAAVKFCLDLPARLAKRAACALDSEIEEAGARINNFMEVALAVHAGEQNLELHLTTQCKVALKRLPLLFQHGLVLRAFLLLHQRVSCTDLKSLEVFFPKDDDVDCTLAATWDSILETLTKMRTRVTESVITLRKFEKENLGPTALEMCA
jgi:hypothetical protein